MSDDVMTLQEAVAWGRASSQSDLYAGFTTEGEHQL